MSPLATYAFQKGRVSVPQPDVLYGPQDPLPAGRSGQVGS